MSKMNYYFYRRGYKLTRKKEPYYFSETKTKNYIFGTDNYEFIHRLTTELNVELSIPPLKYCTDNATMIAAAGYFAYKDGRKADLTLNSKSQDTLK